MFERMERWPKSYFMKIVGSPEQACQQHIRRCYAELDRLEAQLEAVKRLAKAHQNFLDAQDDHHGDPDHPKRVKAWEEKENAYYACYILGIDPKEL